MDQFHPITLVQAPSGRVGVLYAAERLNTSPGILRASQGDVARERDKLKLEVEIMQRQYKAVLTENMKLKQTLRAARNFPNDIA